jgi:type VII secretion-associated serine protease mycosin
MLNGTYSRRSILVAAGLAVAVSGIWLPATLLAVQPAAVAQDAAALARAAEMPELRAVDVPAAWRLTRGRGVTVGVLDTGSDPAAPDLTRSVILGRDFTAGANPAGYQPPHLHGTYIASLIAGHGSGAGRSEGIIGVAPAARILSVRVILDDHEPGFAAFNENAAYYNSIASGVRYAVRHGVSVINMSLGSTYATRGLRNAVGYAISRGVVVVAAAGNNGNSLRRYTPYVYPASLTGVLSVGAVNMMGAPAPFSARNSSVVVSAPGVRIPGAGPGGSYINGSGTSPASALVAGIVALIRSRFPGLSPALVTQAIIDSARRKPPRGYNTRIGFGEVDAAAALAVAARLARRPDAGLAASEHFGGGPRVPIRVVYRDTGRIAALAAIALAAALGFIAAVTALILLTRGRRTPAAPTRPASGPSPTAPPAPRSSP